MTKLSIWDPLIRSYHWLLAGCFFTNFYLLEPGGDAHQWVGYAAFALVIIRLVWGFIGPQKARFSHFLPTRQAFAAHWQHLKQRQIPADSGHNPLGALMVFLLLALFLGQGISGFLLEEVDYFFGNDLMKGIHHWFAVLILNAVIIHVAAVILVGWWGRIALIRPMLSGKRKP